MDPPLRIGPVDSVDTAVEETGCGYSGGLVSWW